MERSENDFDDKSCDKAGERERLKSIAASPIRHSDYYSQFYRWPCAQPQYHVCTDEYPRLCNRKGSHCYCLLEPPAETTKQPEVTEPQETTKPQKTTGPKEATEPQETTKPQETTEPREQSEQRESATLYFNEETGLISMAPLSGEGSPTLVSVPVEEGRNIKIDYATGRVTLITPNYNLVVSPGHIGVEFHPRKKD